MDQIIFLPPRSTWNQPPPGPMLQLSHLADMGFQQQLWIILSLFLVKIICLFAPKYFLLQLYL